MTDLLRCRTSDGKYTIIQDSHGHLFAQRYDEPWPERNLVGDKLVLTLAQDIVALREENKELCEKLEAAQNELSEKLEVVQNELAEMGETDHHDSGEN